MNWKCSNFTEIGKFATEKFGVILAGSLLPEISLPAILKFLSSYMNNPFNDAYNEAQRTGKYLAHLIATHKIFGDS